MGTHPWKVYLVASALVASAAAAYQLSGEALLGRGEASLAQIGSVMVWGHKTVYSPSPLRGPFRWVLRQGEGIREEWEAEGGRQTQECLVGQSNTCGHLGPLTDLLASSRLPRSGLTLDALSLRRFHGRMALVLGDGPTQVWLDKETFIPLRVRSPSLDLRLTDHDPLTRQGTLALYVNGTMALKLEVSRMEPIHRDETTLQQ